MPLTCSCCANLLADPTVEMLNTSCFCITLNSDAVRNALAEQLVPPEVAKLIEERCPHLFSARPVFVSTSQIDRMNALVQAIEEVMALPAYRASVLAEASPIARHVQGNAAGVFFGYDFHVDEAGIGLIEVNTNAGGALLNAVLARAQHACCAAMEDVDASANMAQQFETRIVEMFKSEWEKSRFSGKLETIAIVDVNPEQQYLYAEFLLFQQLFQRHGFRALICDPSTLRWADSALWHDGVQIDMVYNRLTDFQLDEPASAALRAAYVADAVLVSPHPQAHALYADKRNLVLLSSAAQLEALGVPLSVQAVLLASVPRTQIVSAANADELWQKRRNLFFKPTAGYGGRAAYRGDKLTKRVWLEILAGDYIAQDIVPPGRRLGGTVGAPDMLKFDVRCYTYAAEIQWTAARVYQGQTTNFRTPGGGFAPIFEIADQDVSQAISQRAVR